MPGPRPLRPLTEVFKLDELDQLEELRRARRQALAAQRVLNTREDFQRAVAATTPENPEVDCKRLTPHTQAIMDESDRREARLDELGSHLYLKFRRPVIHSEATDTIDTIIGANFGNDGDTRERWHNVMYLASRGGSLTAPRFGETDVSYTFNTPYGIKTVVP
jgi:hypothetical protein